MSEERSSGSKLRSKRSFGRPDRARTHPGSHNPPFPTQNLTTPVKLTILTPAPRTRLRGRMLSLIDHVGVAVADIDSALALYRDALGMELVHRETVAEQGVDAALLDVGDGHVELLQPLGPETAVGKFLARRGPGLHHVAYRVADIDAVLTALAAAGLRLIDESPRVGIRGSRVAFLHPASTGGVLTEIVQPAEDH
jgi:methylmalonyl-CoA/ethylmalonyl-CoA epimerase